MKQLIFFATFCFLTLGVLANASDLPFLEIVSENGTKMQLDKSTVVQSGIGRYENVQNPEEESAYFVFYNLTEKAAHDFTAITRANIGKPIRFFLNGQLLSAPIVREEIVGVQGVISGISKKEAAAIVAAMQQ